MGTILDIYLSFDRIFKNINPENFTFKGKTVTRQNIYIKNISVNLSLAINFSDKIIFVKISMVKKINETLAFKKNRTQHYI